VVIRYTKENYVDNSSNSEIEAVIEEDEALVLSHSFRITRETTFKEVKTAALEYWGIEEYDEAEERNERALKFSLFDEDNFCMTDESGEYPMTNTSIHALYSQKLQDNNEQDSYSIAYLYLRRSDEKQNSDDEEKDFNNNENRNNPMGINEHENDNEKTENAYLARFPGLKPLYLAKKNADPNVKDSHRTCMTFSVYVFMLIFTCLVLFMRPNQEYSVDIIDDIFTAKFEAKTDLEGVISFLREIGEQLLLQEVTTTVDGTTTTVNDIPQIRELSVLVGKIRVRVQKTKTVT